jgi:heme-degrading monooxygenase HmoA
MHVRVTTTRLKAGAEEETARIWREDVGPRLRGLRGFRAVYYAIDPATNEGISVACYDTEEDARAVMDSGEWGRIVAAFADVLDGQPTPRGYRVTYHTAADTPTADAPPR